MNYLIPFVNRPPRVHEVEQLRLALSTFQDGSGQERDSAGNTRAGWRDMERVFAELLCGRAPENKELFDIVVPSGNEKGVIYGVSVKSKELSRVSAIGDLSSTGRVYMELCNSPAKLWEPVTSLGISEADFRSQLCAQEIGESIVETVNGWHTEYKLNHDASNQTIIDINKSVHLVVSYSRPRSGRPREFQIHSFPVALPSGLQWFYNTPRCLRAFDPKYPNEVLLDWYALSGGQLKYYPRASESLYASSRFQLLQPPLMTVKEKASRYWPEKWIDSKGDVELTPLKLASELESYAKLFGSDHSDVLRDCAEKLKRLNSN